MDDRHRIKAGLVIHTYALPCAEEQARHNLTEYLRAT